MSPFPTAEQALKESEPRTLRTALMWAIALHAAAFILTPTLSVRPYELRDELRLEVVPIRYEHEIAEPPPEQRKPEPVRLFEPSESAGAEETIGATRLDPRAAITPPPEERAAHEFTSFDVPPKLVVRVAPVYPELARMAELEGVVGLMIGIDESGNVVTADVVQSVPGLDEAAVEAVLRWKYEPARQRDVPVRVRVFQTVRFRLRD